MARQKEMKLSSFFLFALLLILGAPKVQAAKHYDYVIQNALVFDGDSNKGRRADVGIKGDKIAKIGKIKKFTAGETIDGKTFVLAPGFIDTHTHSDFNPLIYPELPNKVMQGVTTEVVGNCGMSAAPVLGTHKDRIGGVWAREGVEVRGEVRWRTFKEYRETLEKKGMMNNFVGLVGHGNLRSAVMGFSSRPASLGEVDEMRELLRQAMKDGAAGISYGLIYLPGIYAMEDELVDICREAGQNGGICAFHMRNEGAQVIEALQEALRIGQKSGAPVEISHLKAAGKNNWSKIGEAFKLIEDARRKGQHVGADVYPYTGSFAELGVVLPDAVYQREDRLDYFRNPLKREELLAELRKYYEERGMKWDSVMLAATANEKYWPHEGKTLRQIARETNTEPELLLIQILADTKFEVSAYFFSQSEEVVSQAAEKMYTTIGSDSIADGSRRPHPRAFGTFPKVLGEYVRERKMLPLGEAVRKMTSLAADQFFLKERGRIKKGYYADIVLFDAGEVKDKADYANPKAEPKGIQWVFVNGKAVVKKGSFTGTKNGRFLSPNQA